MSLQFSTRAHAESSNAAEIRAQIEVHKFLQFRDARTHTKCLTLRRLNVNTINSIDWNITGILDKDDRLTRLLPIGSPWRRFFDILEPSYDEFVYEFWSTFHFTRNKNLSEPSIDFRLGGKTFNLSLSEFAVHLGIYTEEEVRSPIFINALTEYPDRIQDYWSTLTPAVWSRNNNSRTFRDPLYQYMHRVLANTIRGRTSNLHRVSGTDLFHLYSIFESVHCNIAYSLAMYFEQYQTRPPKNLMGGSYITKIAKSLGVINDQIIQELSPPRLPGVVNFNNIEIIPIDIPTQTQSFQSETAPVIPENTSQNLQQLLLQFPQPSFYQFDLLSQQQLTPPVFEHISTNTSQTQHTQPQTPSIYQALSPLPFGQGEMMQQSIFNDAMTFQELLAPEQLMSPLLQQQSSQHPEQQQPSIVEAGPSTVPLINPPLDPMKVAKLIKKNQKMSRQIEWLTKKNEWQEERLRQVASIISKQFTPPPPSPHDSDSDFDYN